MHNAKDGHTLPERFRNLFQAAMCDLTRLIRTVLFTEQPAESSGEEDQL